MCQFFRSFPDVVDLKTDFAPRDDSGRRPPRQRGDTARSPGKTYVFDLINASDRSHPIHLHGHSFKVLDVERLNLPQRRADTVMLIPRGRARVAFVADNPGDWMFHCHILEHQETGMMSHVKVA